MKREPETTYGAAAEALGLRRHENGRVCCAAFDAEARLKTAATAEDLRAYAAPSPYDAAIKALQQEAKR